MLKPQLVLINCLVISGLVLIHNSQASNYQDSQRYENPNGRMGRCISVNECLTRGFEIDPQSECKNGEGLQPYVCCISDTGFVQSSELNGQRIVSPNDDDGGFVPSMPTTQRTSEQTELFPKPPECGPISLVLKIFGGEETELGEFPWLANLEYEQANGDLVSVCSGNVINKRYVLTAAHCIKGKIEQKSLKLVSLRVGDHNTDTDIDCDSYGCIDPFQRLNVEHVIVHPNFNNNVNKFYNHHDIALIRTDRNIVFTDTVAPICLPDTIPSLPELRTGKLLTVAGWGHNGTVKFTSEKRKVDVPYVDNSDCPSKVAEEQLCAGGEFLKDSCSGDSGGALVQLTRNGWCIEGLVSFGYGCGIEKPAVYTRIRSYIQWIHDNVQH